MNFGVILSGGSSFNQFIGVRTVGSNSVDCFVDAELTSGDLLDDPGPFDATHSGVCIQTGLSDFGAAVTGVSLVSVDDPANGSDNNAIDSLGPGLAVYENIADWAHFANLFRGWGLNGGTFPVNTNRGRCAVGVDCRIWDWSLVAADTVLLDALPVLTGDDTVEHKWYGTAADQIACTALAPGSTFVGPDDCRSTVLRHAIELMGDGFNDNLLCETNEQCLFTPNVGAYAGHGARLSAGTIAPGTVIGVVLEEYESNGY